MNRFKKTSASLLVSAMLIGGSTVWADGSTQASNVLSNLPLLEVSTLAGHGELGNGNGRVQSATFRTPNSLLALQDGSLLVADSRNQLIRKLTLSDASTYAGITFDLDRLGFPIGALSDGKADIALFQGPSGLAADSQGNIYVADADNNAIRKIDASGQVTTVAGNGVTGLTDGTGDKARFNHPQDVAVAADGTIFVADTLNHVIRKIAKDGTVTTLNTASSRVVEYFPGVAESAGDYKDGALQDALFNEPSGLALDAKGNLYVSDTGNHRIRYIDLTAGTVTTVAGGQAGGNTNGSIYEKNAPYAAGGYADGKAAEAQLNAPRGLAVTAEGGLLIADSLNHSIRYLWDGQVTTLAGHGENGNTDGVASSAELHMPTDVVVRKDGSVAIADAYNNKIRLLSVYQLPNDLPKDRAVKLVYGQKIIATEAAPEVVGVRTMVPLRAVTETLGYKVDAQNKGSVRISNGDVVYELVAGNKQVTRIDGDQKATSIALDVAPYVKNDRVYIPVRFFAEEIGLDVQWNAEYQTVILRDKIAATR